MNILWKNYMSILSRGRSAYQLVLPCKLRSELFLLKEESDPRLHVFLRVILKTPFKPRARFIKVKTLFLVDVTPAPTIRLRWGHSTKQRGAQTRSWASVRLHCRFGCRVFHCATNGHITMRLCRMGLAQLLWQGRKMRLWKIRRNFLAPTVSIRF